MRTKRKKSLRIPLVLVILIFIVFLLGINSLSNVRKQINAKNMTKSKICNEHIFSKIEGDYEECIEYYQCSGCGEKEEIYIHGENNPHDFGSESKIKIGTCIELDKEIKTCHRCGYIEEKELTTSGNHEYKLDYTESGTCTKRWYST